MKIETFEMFTNDFVARLLPDVSKAYVTRYWPVVYMAMEEEGLDYPGMMLMALATIAVETGSFNISIREYRSKWNTSEHGLASGNYFDLYDNRMDLGNTGSPDGMRYRGGGAIQLTGRDNYRRIGNQLGVPLEEKPEMIEHPIISARALALFLKNKKEAIDFALAVGDLRKARKLVNGGAHGLEKFRDVYLRGKSLLGIAV